MCTACDISPAMVTAINRMAEVSHTISRDHGFWEDEERILEALSPIVEDWRVFFNALVASKLALIDSESSEALGCVRTGEVAAGFMELRDENWKPNGIASELADIMIRTAELAMWLNIDLGLAIQTKTNYNKTRPHKHGKVM